VSVAASLGFLLNLGSEGIDWGITGAILAGGAVAAPFAAWLVRRVAPRLIGAGVGGLIILTNARTLLNQFGIEGPERTLTYLALAVLSRGALGMAVGHHGEDRLRVLPPEATDPGPERVRHRVAVRLGSARLRSQRGHSRSDSW